MSSKCLKDPFRAIGEVDADIGRLRKEFHDHVNDHFAEVTRLGDTLFAQMRQGGDSMRYIKQRLNKIEERLDRIEGGTQQEQEGPKRPTDEELIAVWVPERGSSKNVCKQMAHYIQSVLDRYKEVYNSEDEAITRLIDLRKILSDDLDYYKGDDNGKAEG